MDKNLDKYSAIDKKQELSSHNNLDQRRQFIKTVIVSVPIVLTLAAGKVHAYKEHGVGGYNS